MSLLFAKEVGYLRYCWRVLSWHVQTRLLKQDLSFVLPTGVEFPLPDYSSFARDVYVSRANVDWNAEYILADFLRQYAADGGEGDFLDVGANIGYYTALLSPLVRRSYAFEPDQRNHEPLSSLLIATGNARLAPMAVTDKPGTARLQLHADSAVSHLTEDENAKDNIEEVETTSLDEFCRAHADVFPVVIKTDIEGYDILALEGAVRVAHQFKPVFCVEFNTGAGLPNDYARLQNFLDLTKYDLFAICRTETSPFGYQYQLKQLKATDLANTYTKMLFLVHPAERYFSQLAADFPAYLRRAMPPAQIHQFLGNTFIS